jgi:hypothetical protein
MFTGVHGSEREHFAVTEGVSGRFKGGFGRFLMLLKQQLCANNNYFEIFFCHLNKNYTFATPTRK